MCLTQCVNVTSLTRAPFTDTESFTFLADMAHIDLTANTSLRSVHFHSLDHPIVALVLSQISILHISKVIFTDTDESLARCVQAENTSLDNMLATNFTHLSDFWVVYRGSQPMGVIVDWTRKVFPQMTSRGIFSIFVSKTELVSTSIRHQSKTHSMN